MSWHVETIRNQYGSHVILLREAWREGKRIRKKTIANLTKLPPEIVEGIRTLLRGGVAVDSLEEVFTIRRSLPHGHAAAVVRNRAKTRTAPSPSQQEEPPARHRSRHYL